MGAIQAYISSNQFLAFAILMAVMVLGEYVSKITRGKVPSALIMMVALIAGFWTILPANLAAAAGLTAPIYSLTVVLLIIHLGTLINRRQMIAQWRTVVISLMGIAAISLFTLTLGGALFGRPNAIAATPVLTGAAIAASIMSEAAKLKGNTTAQLVALVTMVAQAIVGFPLAALCLRKETERLHGLYTEGKLTPESTTVSEQPVENSKKATKKEKFWSVNTIILKLAVIALISYLLQVLTKGYVSQYVWCLLLGFFANELGFLESDALGKAKSDGILMTILLAYLFCSFSFATPKLLLPVIGITLGLTVVAAVGLTAVAFLSHKIFKQESFWSCYAIVLNAFLGFPLNVMLVNEALAFVKDPEERKTISGELMPKMLVAGFVCVTIVSVLVAGILKNYI